MTESRPSPEQMLARLKMEGEEESPRTRGKLKIFFGYAAGVGKTYAMLLAARKLKVEGVDVVAGYVEPHGRPETEALLEGLECLPVLEIPYRGTVLKELDLDAALNRKPQVILVDELAHTNAPGLRHTKRWQDVEELLAAGIDVYTTVNVQHIESLNDVVAQISGVTVRETFPDEILEQAHDLALIDLPPDELMERLKEGKVYIPPQAARALQSFFRKQNLVALRELALREVADRVHVDVEAARHGAIAKVPWPTNERLLVCVGPSPTSAKVIRATKRLADTLRAPWVAVHVETPQGARMSDEDRTRLQHHLRLAESLGGEAVTLTGDDVVRESIEYARARNVTKIVIGKSDQPRSWLFARESLVERLLRDSGNTDVYVIRGVEEPTRIQTTPRPRQIQWLSWLATGAVLLVATLTALLLARLGFAEPNIVMLYLLAVVVVATRFGRWPSIVTSLLAVLLFDVFFTKPYFTVVVHDSEYVFTFVVMLVVGLMASTLAQRIRRQAEISRHNERRLEALYRLSRRLTAISGHKELTAEVEQAISEMFNSYTVLFLPDRHGKIRPVLDSLASFAASATEVAAAQWVLDRGHPAGLGTDTLPTMSALYLPLASPNKVVGVLSLQPQEPEALNRFETRQMLETCCSQTALAIERNHLTEEYHDARVQMETEKLRSSLLSAVSHDLRTPLAVITGASSSLLEARENMNVETRQELLQSIYEESERLSRLVENLLHMTRFSSGNITIRREWQPIDEVIGSTIRRLQRFLLRRRIEVHLPEVTPQGYFDSVLIEQVLMNLLDNAMKYSPPETPIEINVCGSETHLVIEMADRGKGLSPEDQQHLFEKFYRGTESKADRRGAGLGLAICKSIVEAHGGHIAAKNRPGGGAVFRFTLPAPGPPPQVSVEKETEGA